MSTCPTRRTTDETSTDPTRASTTDATTNYRPNRARDGRGDDDDDDGPVVILSPDGP